MNIVFFDGQCGLCDRMVQWLLVVDTRKQFSFAPLQGKTAAKLLSELPAEYKDADSLILVENYKDPHPQVFVFGRAAFRILWILGGWWKIGGILCFFPSFLYDWAYKLVAKNRHKFFADSCIVPSSKNDRFLP